MRTVPALIVYDKARAPELFEVTELSAEQRRMVDDWLAYGSEPFLFRGKGTWMLGDVDALVAAFRETDPRAGIATMLDLSTEPLFEEFLHRVGILPTH